MALLLKTKTKHKKMNGFATMTMRFLYCFISQTNNCNVFPVWYTQIYIVWFCFGCVCPGDRNISCTAAHKNFFNCFLFVVSLDVHKGNNFSQTTCQLCTVAEILYSNFKKVNFCLGSKFCNKCWIGVARSPIEIVLYFTLSRGCHYLLCGERVFCSSEFQSF